MDILPWEGVDRLVDLNEVPWPWEDGTFEYVRAVQIIEHLGELTKTKIVSEIHRILKSDGIAEIEVPNMYNASALQCLEHAHSFYLDTFSPTGYIDHGFGLVSRYVTFSDKGWRIPFVTPPRLPIRIFARLGIIHGIGYILKKI